MRRREYLLLTSAVGIGGIAGCAELRASTRIEIDHFTVQNKSDALRNVHVLLMDGDDPVYWRGVTVDAFDEDANHVGNETLDDYPSKPGEYAVHARLDDGQRSSFDLTTLETDCCSVEVDVGWDGNLAIFWSGNCDRDR